MSEEKSKSLTLDSLFFRKSVDQATEAVELENEGGYIMAYHMYLAAVDSLDEFKIYNKDPKLEQLASSQISQYIARAKFMENIVKSTNIIAPPNSIDANKEPRKDTQLFQTAIQLVHEATALDNNKEYEKAYTKYLGAADALMEFKKHNTTPKLLQLADIRATQYLNRAQLIYTWIKKKHEEPENNNTQTTFGAPACDQNTQKDQRETNVPESALGNKPPWEYWNILHRILKLMILLWILNLGLIVTVLFVPGEFARNLVGSFLGMMFIILIFIMSRTLTLLIPKKVD